eukprot:6419278-Pyramimonas_sp.AAC.2
MEYVTSPGGTNYVYPEYYLATSPRSPRSPGRPYMYNATSSAFQDLYDKFYPSLPLESTAVVPPPAIRDEELYYGGYTPIYSSPLRYAVSPPRSPARRSSPSPKGSRSPVANALQRSAALCSRYRQFRDLHMYGEYAIEQMDNFRLLRVFLAWSRIATWCKTLRRNFKVIRPPSLVPPQTQNPLSHIIPHLSPNPSQIVPSAAHPHEEHTFTQRLASHTAGAMI